MSVLDRILNRIFHHRITVRVTCPACNGSGYADYAAVACELCLGEKSIKKTYRLAGEVSS